MQTRQQKDSLRALEDVQAIRDSNEDDLKKTYARAVYRFPFLVRQNGLQQTLGFYEGKAKPPSASGAEENASLGNAEEEFLKHIAQVLGIQRSDLISTISGVDVEKYMYLSRRCLEVALWYRRFTASVLGVDITGNPTEEQVTAEGGEE
ncbi:MAG: type III-B CRISPR module-associated protein Cmr5 [Candidatus Electrothrix sp. GM3_4]|nr:type III-B CRISPR module-associated protein Cmr5 [Candidatus Electrothrix sp. GM3_4]